MPQGWRPRPIAYAGCDQQVYKETDRGTVCKDRPDKSKQVQPVTGKEVDEGTVEKDRAWNGCDHIEMLYA